MQTFTGIKSVLGSKADPHVTELLFSLHGPYSFVRGSLEMMRWLCPPSGLTPLLGDSAEMHAKILLSAELC